MAKADYKKPDYYARRAKEKGFASRSVFKLEDIDEKERLLWPGARVLDLGAAPGSWMKYASEKAGEKGLVVGVDLRPLKRQLNPNERFIQADVNELGPKDITEQFLMINCRNPEIMKIHGGSAFPGAMNRAQKGSPTLFPGQGFDLVLSDMMPNTIGHKESDHYRSVALAQRALDLADALLRPGGHFLVKLFQGADFESFRGSLRERFLKVKVKKPKSSRPSSREIYLLGIKKTRQEGG